MAEEKILTRHPRGKSGKNISRKRYATVKGAILAALRTKELTHTELSNAVAARLEGKFDGNIKWYAETVKLDLEARHLIERTPTKPQRYRMLGFGKEPIVRRDLSDVVGTWKKDAALEAALEAQDVVDEAIWR